MAFREQSIGSNLIDAGPFLCLDSQIHALTDDVELLLVEGETAALAVVTLRDPQLQVVFAALASVPG
jgi:hypothetical protein